MTDARRLFRLLTLAALACARGLMSLSVCHLSHHSPSRLGVSPETRRRRLCDRGQRRGGSFSCPHSLLGAITAGAITRKMRILTDARTTTQRRCHSLDGISNGLYAVAAELLRMTIIARPFVPEIALVVPHAPEWTSEIIQCSIPCPNRPRLDHSVSLLVHHYTKPLGFCQATRCSGRGAG